MMCALQIYIGIMVRFHLWAKIYSYGIASEMILAFQSLEKSQVPLLLNFYMRTGNTLVVTRLM